MMQYRRTLGAILLLGLVVACPAAACSATGNGQTGSTGGAGGGGGNGTLSNSSNGAGMGGDPGLDAGGGDGSVSPTCQYVDILFLIDNSASMLSQQKKLAGAWPQFVDAIYTHLPAGIDLHVGITTTAFFVGSTAEGTSNCMSSNTPADVAAHFIPPGTMNNGDNGGQGRLYQFQGKNFYDAVVPNDKQGMKDWFSAAATSVGQFGSSFEFSSAGVAYATDPANAQTNAGFFRDADGVLVLIFLTDEPDKSYDVEPDASHYHAMTTSVKQKCGGDKCIITAGIIDPCVQSSNQFLWQFMTSFGNANPPWTDIDGMVPEYTQVIGDSLAQVVKKTCDDIAVPK